MPTEQLVAKVTVLVKESKAIVATQNDTINELKANVAAQDDSINELKANMAAQNDTINVLKANMAAQNDTINVLKVDIAAKNDKIIAQADTINELKDTINELKANMAAQDLAQGATIEKLEAEILVQGGTSIIKTLEAAKTDVRRQHTLEIDQLNMRLTESSEELAEMLTAHSAETKKLQNDNKQQQKCIRVLMPHARNVVCRKWLEGFRDVQFEKVGGRRIGESIKDVCIRVLETFPAEAAEISWGFDEHSRLSKLIHAQPYLNEAEIVLGYDERYLQVFTVLFPGIKPPSRNSWINGLDS